MQPFGIHNKLTSLTPAQTDQIASWLLDDNLTQHQAAQRITKTFGFKIGQAAVSKFWRRECVPRKLLRASEVAGSVQAVARMLKNDWQDANAQLIGQKIFETLSDPATDIKRVCALGAILERIKTRGVHEKALKAKIAVEKQRSKQRDRQMALAREKFEFDAVEAVLKQAGKIKTISTDRALSSDEKREGLRRLLFPIQRHFSLLLLEASFLGGELLSQCFFT